MDPLYFRENASKGEDAIVFVHGGGVSGWAWHAARSRNLKETSARTPDTV